MQTITVHGTTYATVEAAALLAKIAELNTELGESDGRVTLANALSAGLAAAASPAPTRRRTAQRTTLASVYCWSPKGAYRKFAYRDWETMEAGIKRLEAKGYTIESSC